MQTITIKDELFFKIADADTMRPFFMSIVSDSNHWMFISSNGGISAGRKNSDHAIFPYYTDDKITESAEITGSKTIFQIIKNDKILIWEPFSIRDEGKYKIQRNLYKNTFGNKIIFEEINKELSLSFQYEWNSSNLHGFVKRSRLQNLSSTTYQINILDGLQNVLPYGVGADLQNQSSNLVDAYKRSELIPESGVGIFALSAIIVDKAEPSEALKANITWSTGFSNPTYLLSSLQLNNFRLGKSVNQEEDIKGEKGAYFIVDKIIIEPSKEKEWMIIANVNQNHASIIQLSNFINTSSTLSEKILADVNEGTLHLKELTAAADSFQKTSDVLQDTRHYSNVLFNIMRGGIFDNNYQIEKWDFCKYLEKANPAVYNESSSIWQQLDETFSLQYLKKVIASTNNLNFERLAIEYLPLKFSRRHGDPSRPWNQFSINTRSEIDGSKILDYQGNWRDIFQNWEALVHSYPAFIDGMIWKFLNASTFDGYNPYRVTKDGFDWEAIEPDNPWSYIGYWGDHQIIYLLKLLEFKEQYNPGSIERDLEKNGFVYANVPYRIKSYSDIVQNPKDTIEFDHEGEKKILDRKKSLGADGALLTNKQSAIYHISFVEKILATVLSKLSNFVPEGGIWMNTQRPEWNDANNALVGNGISMVTLYYLRRFLKFFQPIFKNSKDKTFSVSDEIHHFFVAIQKVLVENKNLLSTSFDDKNRKRIVDTLGVAGSDFRNQIYSQQFSGAKKDVTGGDLLEFANLSLQFMEHSIQANKRTDGMYHSYNLININQSAVSVSHLSEMLEGQVAVLSSGYLTAEESLNVLDSLKESKLYRKDQSSYILYPNKSLSKFIEKNTIPSKSVEASALLKKLQTQSVNSIVEKDINGNYHFNGNFRNARDLENAIDSLNEDYKELAIKDRELLLQIFEEVFNHKEFTGRSGTFYGYEGLGSIYWHMVSKLLLAVQETCIRAIDAKTSTSTTDKLVNHFYEIFEGIGVHKSPATYGAFPTDPYSHTPIGKGAQQPGMTGQVKEDILSRLGELGVFIISGQLHFNPCLLQKKEFITTPAVFEFVNVNLEHKKLPLEKDSLCFTCCQVPIVYKISTSNKVELINKNNTLTTFENLNIDIQNSNEIFGRTGEVVQITVHIEESKLR